MMTNKKVISMKEVIGGSYNRFWNFKGRYRVVKGSRASKKSKTTALNQIKRLMEYPQSNLLVVRKVFGTLKDSCFTELKWAINRLGVKHLWDIKYSPLEMTYKPTGQKIFFRGLDDPLKVTSITVEVGVLCFMWIEEAYEIQNEADFDMLDESIRGQVPEGLFKQITITLNPWNEKHWIKRRFFDRLDDDVLALTTNYLCNEFLDDADRKVFEKMKKDNPRRYKVAGLGEWGIADGLVFENWEEWDFNIANIKKIPGIQSAFGLDFGYSIDPAALFCGLVDLDNKEIYVFDELYKQSLTNDQLADAIRLKGYGKEKVIADSSEPKSIAELKQYGLKGVRKAKKGKDSVNHGIQFIQNFKIYVHPKCVNFITEISNYGWDKDRLGNTLTVPMDDFNHLMDAFRYALEPFSKSKMFGF